MTKIFLYEQVKDVHFGTQADIEALTGVTAGAIGYATDRSAYEHFGTYNGASWEWNSASAGAVDSVNGQTGTVVLDQDDVGDGTTYKQYSGTEKTKLAGIEASADVTDIANVGSSLHGASADTPLDADEMSFWDTVDAILKKITWANIKATLKTYFDTLYAPAAKGVTNGDTHNHDLGDGGTLTESALSLADVTTINASTSAHGFLKKLSNVATEFMNGVGNWAAITLPIPIGAHGLNVGIAASTTMWTCPNVGGLQAGETAMLYTIGGTLKNLYIRIGGTQPASGSLVCTLRVNNADTALVVTVPAGSAAGNYSDTTHTVALSAGDRVGWKIVNNATGTSAVIGATVVEMDVANV